VLNGIVSAELLPLALDDICNISDGIFHFFRPEYKE